MANLAIAQTDFESQRPPWEKLELVKKEKPHGAKPGHVLVRITVRPINPTDLLTIGSNQLRARNSDGVVGIEGFGIVEEVGEGVTNLKVGQRVVPIPRFQYLASWQQYVEIEANQAFPVPDSISDEVAAQAVINPVTVYAILKVLDIPKGEYLLQTAASSVLGRLLIELAKHQGVKTINVVRRDDVKKELKALGADEVINSETEDVVARVKEITGGKLAYAAVDAVLGKLTKAVGSSLRDGGELLLYGALSGFDVVLDARDLGFGRKINVSVFTLYQFLKTQEDFDNATREVFKLLENKVFDPLVGQKFDLVNFQDAIIASQEVARGGKVLLVG